MKSKLLAIFLLAGSSLDLPEDTFPLESASEWEATVLTAAIIFPPRSCRLRRSIRLTVQATSRPLLMSRRRLPAPSGLDRDGWEAATSQVTGADGSTGRGIECSVAAGNAPGRRPLTRPLPLCPF